MSIDSVASTLRAKLQPMYRNVRYGRLEFFTLHDMVDMIRDWVQSWKRRYDVIVGIPRSGLLVANAIGMMLGRPVATPRMIVDGSHPWFRSGRQVDIEKVVLVDDSISSGATMQKYSSLLERYDIEHDTAALFAKNQSVGMVDLYHTVTGGRRLFEWNMMHSKHGTVGFDMDGVLCENCPDAVKGNIDDYRGWVRLAKPFLIPDYVIDVIVSNRPECVRCETEQWLDEHDVQYEKLVLWDTGYDERRGGHAENKARMVKKHHPELFFESNPWQAKKVWSEVGIPVICVETMEAHV